MRYEIGEKVQIDGEIRTLTGIKTNTEGKQIFVWHSRKNAEGACIPSLWQEWRGGEVRGRRSAE